MAYYDHAAAMAEKRREELLEKYLVKLKGSADLEDREVYHEIRDIQGASANKDRKLSKYSKFFEDLSDLMPKKFSAHDIIG